MKKIKKSIEERLKEAGADETPRIGDENAPSKSDASSERQQSGDSEVLETDSGIDVMSLPLGTVPTPDVSEIDTEDKAPPPAVADEIAPLLPSIFQTVFEFTGKKLGESEAKDLSSTLMSCPAIAKHLDGLEVFQGPEGCLALFGMKAAVYWYTAEPIEKKPPSEPSSSPMPPTADTVPAEAIRAYEEIKPEDVPQ